MNIHQRQKEILAISDLMLNVNTTVPKSVKNYSSSLLHAINANKQNNVAIYLINNTYSRLSSLKSLYLS